jgi:hypothetical protein
VPETNISKGIDMNDIALLTILGVVDGDRKVLCGPELLTFQVDGAYLLRHAVEVWAVVRNTDDEETGRENRLALGEWHLALVKSRWSTNLTKAGNEPVQGLGGSSDNERLRTIVERYSEFRIPGEVLVRVLDVLLEDIECEPGNT